MRRLGVAECEWMKDYIFSSPIETIVVVCGVMVDCVYLHGTAEYKWIAQTIEMLAKRLR